VIIPFIFPLKTISNYFHNGRHTKDIEEKESNSFSLSPLSYFEGVISFVILRLFIEKNEERGKLLPPTDDRT